MRGAGVASGAKPRDKTKRDSTERLAGVECMTVTGDACRQLGERHTSRGEAIRESDRLRDQRARVGAGWRSSQA